MRPIIVSRTELEVDGRVILSKMVSMQSSKIDPKAPTEPEWRRREREREKSSRASGGWAIERSEMPDIFPWLFQKAIQIDLRDFWDQD